MIDPFDPNAWVVSDREFRLYGNNQASIWAIVDEEDYHWAIRWTWHAKPSKSKHKFYLRRNTWVTSQRRLTVFLHKEICYRAYGNPPTPAHTITDHRDGDSLNCRRSNLRWVTPTQNRMNLNGMYPYDFLV